MLSSEQLKRYAKNATLFVEEILGVTPHPWQREVLDCISVSNKPCTIRSGAGAGKSTLEAWVILWFISTRPYPRIAATAPTEHHLFDVLWAEIKEWMDKSEILKNNLEWSKTKISMKDKPGNWYAVARVGRVSGDAVTSEGLQGFHAKHTLFVVDEASGVPDQALAAIDGIMATGKSKVLMCGNPVRLTGMFYDSFNKYPELFNTFHWNCEEIAEKYKGLQINEDYITLQKAKYGEESAIYEAKVRGNFPSEDSFVLFSPRSLEQMFQPNVDVPNVSPTIAADIADGGDDESVFSVRYGHVIVEIYGRRGLDTEANADEIQRLSRKYPNYRKILIDTVGVGTGVLSVLRRRKVSRIFGVKGSYAASKDNQSGDPRLFYNLKSEVYFSLARMVRDKRLIIKPLGKKELITRDFMHIVQEPREDGLFQVIPKVKLKKAGIPSPDYSDNLMISFAQDIGITRAEQTASSILQINVNSLKKTSFQDFYSVGSTRGKQAGGLRTGSGERSKYRSSRFNFQDL
jgi:phage terminase large subunit